MIEQVLDYWFDGWEETVEKPFAEDPALQRWWGKNDATDRHITQTYGHLLEQDLDDWESTPRGVLAKIIVLDQFSRVVHRGSGRAFENDPEARATLRRALDAGVDDHLSWIERGFLYMPFMHSEAVADHDRAVELFTQLTNDSAGSPRAANYQNNLEYEHKHRDIIVRFGRYPHRNQALGRESAPEEVEFLKQPGSSF